MKSIRKHFPNIGDQLHEVVKLLKGYRGASLVRRIRYVRSGEYMLRIHNEQGQVVVCGPRMKSERESIRQYNEIINSIGQDLPEVIPDKEPDFFDELEDDEDEEDFFSTLDGDTDSVDEEAFFDDLIDDDEFFNAL